MWEIGWRNPIEFITQWWTLKERIRGIFIWCLYAWYRNDLDVWEVYGIRIFGIEIQFKHYI
jgi:hypothetical protein